MDPIEFRPHHFLCALGFKGKGYSKDFVLNFQSIVDQLNSRSGDHLTIQIARKTDSICGACPYKQGHLCEKQEQIESLDHRHEKALGLSNVQKLSWKEAKQKMKSLGIERFHEICQGCQWKSLGVCESSLKALKSEP